MYLSRSYWLSRLLLLLSSFYIPCHFNKSLQIAFPNRKPALQDVFFSWKRRKKHAAILKSRNYKISRLSSLSDTCKLPLWAFPAIKAGMRGVVSPFVILRAPLVAAPLHFISCSLGVFHVLEVPVFQYLVPRVLVGCLCMFSTMSTLYVLQWGGNAQHNNREGGLEGLERGGIQLGYDQNVPRDWLGTYTVRWEVDCNGEAALVKKKIKIKKKCTAEQFLFPFVDTFEKYLAIRLVAEAQVRNSRRCSMFTLV